MPVLASPASRRRIMVAAVVTGVFAMAVAVGIAFAPHHIIRAVMQRTAPVGPPSDQHVPATSRPATVDVAGVELPVSSTHGPRHLRDGLASGFSNSEVGAALAAVHLLMRTSATAGPRVFEPTITAQVTGANAAVMKLYVADQYAKLRRSHQVADGASIDGADAQPVGYRIAAYASRTAVIDVGLTSPQLQESQRLLQFTVSLRWINDDWRAVAPPRGDWGSVAVPLGSTPAGLRDYGDIR